MKIARSTSAIQHHQIMRRLVTRCSRSAGCLQEFVNFRGLVFSTWVLPGRRCGFWYLAYSARLRSLLSYCSNFSEEFRDTWQTPGRPPHSGTGQGWGSMQECTCQLNKSESSCVFIIIFTVMPFRCYISVEASWSSISLNIQLSRTLMTTWNHTFSW